MKRLYFFLFFITTFAYSQQPPLIINSSNKIIDDLCNQLSRNLPKNIEILIFDINLLNISDFHEVNLKNNIETLLSDSSKKHAIKIILQKEIPEKDQSVKEILSKFPSENDLMAIANYLKSDVVLMINITQIKKESRNVWSQKNRSIQKKDIFLFQANLYKPDNHSILLRFYNYFYID